jgi:hypothetical protein
MGIAARSRARPNQELPVSLAHVRQVQCVHEQMDVAELDLAERIQLGEPSARAAIGVVLQALGAGVFDLEAHASAVIESEDAAA